MINESKYGQTWKIWPSLLSLWLYSTFKGLSGKDDTLERLFLKFNWLGTTFLYRENRIKFCQ